LGETGIPYPAKAIVISQGPGFQLLSEAFFIVNLRKKNFQAPKEETEPYKKNGKAAD
jgi:hypothetical protein